MCITMAACSTIAFSVVAHVLWSLSSVHSSSTYSTDNGMFLYLKSHDPPPPPEPEVITYTTVHTKTGKLGGTVHHDNDMVTTRFLGIPYAQPPIGTLRFKKPIKFPGWFFDNGGALNATEYRDACPQNITKWGEMLHPDVYTTNVRHTRISEDCLYLNIFVPRNMSGVEHVNTLSLPVLIYLHGGDFQTGDPMLYGGWRLAHYSDVIVVTLNYRLGVFGFFSVQDESSPGNLGLYDQRMAMHWIWDNIREFGGNPEKITIFGDSAGGMSAGYHVISPASRGLFTGAILQSATMYNHNIQWSPVPRAIELARHFNCPEFDYDKTLSCLQKVPFESIYKESLHIGGDYWTPVVDGEFLTNEPIKLLQQKQFHNVNLLVGYNSIEGYNQVKHILPDIDSGLSEDMLEDLIRNVTYSIASDNKETLLASVNLEYNFCTKPEIQRSHTLVNFFSEYYHIAPVELACRYLSRGTRSVYLYEFDHAPSYKRSQSSVFVGGTKGDEVPFVFGHAHYTMSDMSREERRLSEAMMTVWGNFARTGDPNPINDEGIHWKPYTEGEKNYFVFTAGFNYNASRVNPRPRRMAFWNDYIPNIVLGSGCSTSGDVCSHQIRSLEDKNVKTSNIVWGLTALCVVLAILVIILLLRLLLWPRYCFGRHKHLAMNGRPHIIKDSEITKLHPLPYRDENDTLS